jgi:hypothetical protein
VISSSSAGTVDRVGKTPGLKKNRPVGFFYNCPEERFFRVFSVSRIL